MDLLKIAPGLRQHIVRFFQEPCHQFAGTGHGGVNDNGKVLYPVNLL